MNELAADGGGPATHAAIAGIVLAGGKSSRMGGGDKCMLPLGSATMLGRAIECLSPQVGAVALNANGDPARFQGFGLVVVPDTIGSYAGPLAGIHAGMGWALTHENRFTHVVSVAADTPFFPRNLVRSLVSAVAGEHRAIGLARSNGRAHPVFGLWPLALHDELQAFLQDGATFKVRAFADRHDLTFADFPLTGGFDPFFNVNTPVDLARAEERLAELRS